MTKTKLTDKQRDVLGFIEQMITTRGVSPTIREIGKKFGIKSTNGVRLHLNALIKKGYLKIHIAVVNIQSKKIISIKVTIDEHVHDSKVLPKLVESISKSKNDIISRQGICRWCLR